MGQTVQKKENKYTRILAHVNRLDVITAVIGCFLAISTISYISMNYNSAFLIASFGASAVILYATPDGIFARPQNLIGGHLLAATTGVILYNLVGTTWWSLSLGVTITILLMMLTSTIHPPAGATAIVAIVGKASVSFIIMPVFTGVMILFIWSIIMNRIRKKIKDKR